MSKNQIEEMDVLIPTAMAIAVGVDSESGEEVVVMETTFEAPEDAVNVVRIAYNTEQILEFRDHLDKALNMLSVKNDGYIITN